MLASAEASLLKRQAPIYSSTDDFTRDKREHSMARKAKFTTKMRFNTNTKQNELQTGGSGWMVAGPDSGLRLSAQLSEAKTGNFLFLDRKFEAAMSRTNLLGFRGSRRFFSACGVVCPRPETVTLSPRRSPGDQGCGLRPHLTVRS